MRVLAGIVLYNPDIYRLQENINAVISQVERVLLVDNNSDNIKEVEEILLNNNLATIIKNASNEGIASALHRIMLYAKNNQFEWVLSLDQDSVCKGGLLNEYEKWTSEDGVGILTCNIIDRNFTRECSYEYMPEIVDLCITSGSLTSVNAYFHTEGYDTNLFIDSVDHDLCCNMRKHGYKILRVPYHGLLHEIGKGKKIRILNRELILYNHNPYRQYYIARNKFILCFKYPDEYKLGREALLEIKKEIDILLFERNKLRKIVSRWRGLRDAWELKREIYDKTNV